MIQPRVFIIVLNYNGCEDTLECLASCERQNYPELAVLLADNGSSDGSVVAVKECFPEVRVIENGENLGFAAGNNRAISLALSEGADYVMLLNNDAIAADQELVTKLVDFERSNHTGPVSPVVLYTGTDTVWMGGARVDYLLGRIRHLGIGKSYADFSSLTPYPAQYVSGCCMLLSRALLEELGLLDEDYFFFYEDVDYCFRAAAAGKPSYVVPGAFVHHRKSASSGTAGKNGVSQFRAYHMGRSAMIFAGKRLSGNRRLSFTVAQWTFTLAYVAVMSRSAAAVRDYFKGMRDGFREARANATRSSVSVEPLDDHRDGGNEKH